MVSVAVPVKFGTGLPLLSSANAMIVNNRPSGTLLLPGTLLADGWAFAASGGNKSTSCVGTGAGFGDGVGFGGGGIGATTMVETVPVNRVGTIGECQGLRAVGGKGHLERGLAVVNVTLTGKAEPPELARLSELVSTAMPE